MLSRYRFSPPPKKASTQSARLRQPARDRLQPPPLVPRMPEDPRVVSAPLRKQRCVVSPLLFYQLLRKDWQWQLATISSRALLELSTSHTSNPLTGFHELCRLLSQV